MKVIQQYTAYNECDERHKQRDAQVDEIELEVHGVSSILRARRPPTLLPAGLAVAGLDVDAPTERRGWTTERDPPSPRIHGARENRCDMLARATDDHAPGAVRVRIRAVPVKGDGCVTLAARLRQRN